MIVLLICVTSKLHNLCLFLLQILRMRELYIGMSYQLYNKLSIERVISNLVTKFLTQVGFEQDDMTLTL